MSTLFIKDSGNTDKEIKQSLKSKINIYQGNLNGIGDTDYSLSKSWYTKRKESIASLRNNIMNYFMNKMKAKSNEIMWTTFKDYQSKVKGKGYSKGFIPCNIRATNDYKDKKYLAYTVNRFVNPIIKGFFEDKGIHINEDQYALSELIQWLFRSAIREGNQIHIYIPSKRSRELLIHWLES